MLYTLKAPPNSFYHTGEYQRLDEKQFNTYINGITVPHIHPR